MDCVTGHRAAAARFRAIALAIALGLPLIAVYSCDSATSPPDDDPDPPDTPAVASPRTSVLTISRDSLEVGDVATVTLTARDSAGNDLATGGSAVEFTVLSGSSHGSFTPTVDVGDGTYRAEFTGTVAGGMTTIGATLDGEALTTSLPRIRVFAPPLPPGGVVCEATGSARCWYVAAAAAADGDGSFERPFRLPQDGVNAARPGDFVYLRGGAEYTHEHAADGRLFNIDGRNTVHGEPGRIITIKSYPGEQATSRGQSIGNITTVNLGINISRNYWRVEGLRLIRGEILIANQFAKGIHHVWVVGNHVSDTRLSIGNGGIISIVGDQLPNPGHPRDIFIWNNVAHTTWGMQQDGSGPRPWNTDLDIEHHACLMLQHASGLVEIVGNQFYECPSIFYSKYFGDGPTLVRNNYGHTAQRIAYRWRSSQVTFENNVFARAGRLDITQGDVQAAVFVRNTFDLAPWTLNPNGTDGAIAWNDRAHVFRENVVMAPRYHFSAPSAGSDIDRNCVIWDNSLVATSGYTWDQYQSAFGYDSNGVRVFATNPNAVFANRMGGNYALIGDALQRCPTAGARN